MCPMLIVLQQLQQRNEYLEACEDGEKHRFSQLMKRRQALRKKIEAKRNRTLKIQNWRERNRNYSECSVLTTSSGNYVPLLFIAFMTYCVTLGYVYVLMKMFMPNGFIWPF